MSTPSPRRYLPVVIALLALALGLGLGLLMRQPPPPPQVQATVLPQPRALQPFELRRAAGGPFTHADLQGRWSFVFFGYTHCPDVCPTSLTVLDAVAGRLTRRAAAPPWQVVFVSVDPERDTGARLREFVGYFNDDFIGVTGTPEAVRALTGQIGVMYVRAEGDSESGYLVDHTASIFLFDPEGRQYALFSPPLDPDTIAEDFLKLAHHYEASR